MKTTQIKLSSSDVDVLFDDGTVIQEVLIGKKVRLIEISVDPAVIFSDLDPPSCACTACVQGEEEAPPKMPARASEMFAAEETRRHIQAVLADEQRQMEERFAAEKEAHEEEDLKRRKLEHLSNLISGHHDRLHGLCIHGEPRGDCKKGGYNAEDLQLPLW